MELKTAIDNVKQAKVLLSDANNIMSANVSRLKNIESENAKLRHEIFDKHMELPLDADGVPIRLGDLVWYVGTDHEITNDDPQQVVGLVTVFAADGTFIMTRDYPDKAMRPKMLTHKQPEPPDSWEKLEEDAKTRACDYAHAPRDEYGGAVCCGCRFQKSESCSQEMAIDIIARAKKLSGIEEQEGK